MTRQQTDRPRIGLVCAERNGDDRRLATVLDSAGMAVDTDAESDAVDCLVTADPDAVTGREPVPAVLYGAPESAPPDRFDGVVRPGDPEALADQIRWVIRRDAAGHARRVERLHELATGLVGSTEIEDLFERAVDVAARVLPADEALLCVGDGTVVVRAATASAQSAVGTPVSRSDTVVGSILRSGDSVLRSGEAATTDSLPVDREPRSLVGVPVDDDAVLVVLSRETSAFDTRDRRLLELLATYVSGIRLRIRSETGLRERRGIIEQLHQSTATLATVRTIDELSEATVEFAERILDLDSCFVGFREGDCIVPRATSSGTVAGDLRGISARGSYTEKAIREGEAYLLDSMADPTTATATRVRYSSGLVIPIGEEGVFQAISRQVGAFDETDLEHAELLIAHVDAALKRIQAESKFRWSRERLAKLHQSTAEMVACPDEASLWKHTVRAAADILAFDTSYLFVVDEDGDRFVPAAQSVHPDHEEVTSVPIDHGLASDTYRTGESHLVEDFGEDDRADPMQDLSGGGISVPVGDVGVFQAVSRESNNFDETDLELAELLAAHVSATLDRMRAEAELREERDRLGALFENVPDAAVAYEFVDDVPLVRAVNSAFERTFGFDADEVVGSNLDDYVVPPNDEAVEAEASSLNERLQRGESIRTECRRHTADGVSAFILHVVPLELGTENVAGYAIYTDISDRQEREQELRRQNERLEEFANIVSHDLRNPLSIATGYLDLARETGSEASFDRVEAALDRMERLVENLLSLARKGQVVGETTCLDATTVAERAWVSVETESATLSTPATIDLEADEARLLDLFENLFGNAVEHGGESVAVTVEPTPEGFAVEDDGPGIPEERREAVFEPGQTTGEDGIGFGLPIVKRIVEAHGWRLDLVDGDSGGARFEIRV